MPSIRLLLPFFFFFLFPFCIAAPSSDGVRMNVTVYPNRNCDDRPVYSVTIRSSEHWCFKFPRPYQAWKVNHAEDAPFPCTLATFAIYDNNGSHSQGVSRPAGRTYEGDCNRLDGQLPPQNSIALWCRDRVWSYRGICEADGSPFMVGSFFFSPPSIPLASSSSLAGFDLLAYVTGTARERLILSY